MRHTRRRAMARDLRASNRTSGGIPPSTPIIRTGHTASAARDSKRTPSLTVSAADVMRRLVTLSRRWRTVEFLAGERSVQRVPSGVMCWCSRKRRFEPIPSH